MVEAARDAGFRVPDDVAVIGGYNDDLMSEIATPPLSYVDHFPEHIGYRVAELLARLMKGRKPPRSAILLPPAGVSVRQSTDTLAIDDVDVVDALKFVRDHAHEPITVEDVLDAAPVSRRVLEQRFVKYIGRSPAAEIRRAHLDRAKSLLTRTDLAIPRVAAASGFNHPEVMTRVFRRELGTTPTAYRRRHRIR